MVDFALPSITDEELKEVTDVLKSGWLTTGKKNKELAEKINEYVGSKYCVLLNSCTAALHLALIASGVKEGDEVITTPMTFVSTINAIMWLKAKPVLVDIKPNDFIIDESKIEEKITDRTKAILPVHYAGFSADLERLRQIAKKHNLALIEDAAHAFGTKYKGELIGRNSEFCCYSFYPTKNITTIEGGALVTNNEEVYKRVSSLALHGITRDAWKRYTKEGTWRYDVEEVGYKYNLPDIQAALGLIQLKRIDELKKIREEINSYYVKELSTIDGVEVLKGNSYSDAFRHLFVIRLTSKVISQDEFINRMKEKDIVCSVHFIPVYKFTAYRSVFPEAAASLPVTEEVSEQCVSLPFGNALTTVEAEKVVAAIKEVLA